MEQRTPSNQATQTLAQVKAGLKDYEQNRAKADVWNKIFWVLELYLGKDAPIPLEGQRTVNFFLENKAETSQLGPLIAQHKHIICKLFELGQAGCETIDEAISTGSLGEALARKFIRSSDDSSRATFKLIYFCAQAVLLHFCEFLRRFKEGQGSSIVLTSRRIPSVLKRKHINVAVPALLAQKMFSQPVVLLEGFLDLLKPMIANHLNIESLFEVTSPHFKLKKAFLCGNVNHNNQSQFHGKIMKLNNIFDSTHAGRQMVQNRLSNLQIIPESPLSTQFWSLTTCITQLQPLLQHICEQLPLMLRPKSNGDVLSFSRYEQMPTFKYQVSKAGFISRPVLSDFVTVIMNVGKIPVQVVGFSNQGGVGGLITAKIGSGGMFQGLLDSLGVQYAKVRVGNKGLAVVPSNVYYVIVTTPAGKQNNQLSQIVYWSVLPKLTEQIKSSISAIEHKKKQYQKYNWWPMQQIFLDYLSHEYLQADPSTLPVLKSYIETQLDTEQQLLFSQTKKNPQIPITVTSSSPFTCFSCRQFFLNYYCKCRNENLCLKCVALSDGERDKLKIEEFVVKYRPHDLRYPLTLVSLFLAKRKIPGCQIDNRYESSICAGKFVGAIDTENCKMNNQSEETKHSRIKSSILASQLFFENLQKQFGISSPSEQLINIAMMEPQNQAERNALMQKIKMLVNQIDDQESVVKEINSRVSMHNMAIEIMWSFKLLTSVWKSDQ